MLSSGSVTSIRRPTAVLLALHHHGAVEPPLEVRRQPVIGGIHTRKFRMATRGRDLDAIEERGAVRAPVVALVGVEPHLAVAERAERLAVGGECGTAMLSSLS